MKVSDCTKILNDIDYICDVLYPELERFKQEPDYEIRLAGTDATRAYCLLEAFKETINNLDVK